MKHIITIALLLIIKGSYLNAQKHDYIWLLGSANGSVHDAFFFDFNGKPHFELTPISIIGTSTRLSISDAAGNFSLYSGGCDLRNKDGEVVLGGESINEGFIHDMYCVGGYPLVHGMFSLPMTGSKYYILHSLKVESDSVGGNQCTTGALLLSIVDIGLNNGKGQVLIKDSTLVSYCLQTANAVRHANGRDWWVLMGSNSSDTMHRILVTPTGIQGPYEQVIANPARDEYYFKGNTIFSPDGNIYVIGHDRVGLAIYDFDRCTGLLSNMRFISRTSSEWGNGSAISPNSQYLYSEKAYNMVQWDLKSPDIDGSAKVVATWDGFKDTLGYDVIFQNFENGPDGKIYNWGTGQYHIHRIEFPSRPGMDCSFKQRAIQTPYWTFSETMVYPNYRLGPLDGSSCDTLGIDNHPIADFRWDIEDTLAELTRTFTDNSYYNPTSWHWDFGDGTISQDQNPIHIFPDDGIYHVCLTVCNQYACDTLCEDVLVGTVKTVEPKTIQLLTLFPNPADDILIVQIDQNQSWNGELNLFNIIGEKVRSVAFVGNMVQLEVFDLVPGIYIAQLNDPKKQLMAIGRAVVVH